MDNDTLAAEPAVLRDLQYGQVTIKETLMCCRYYVESTPYFLELGELAKINTMKNKSLKHDGTVVISGEISPGNQVPVIASNKAGKRTAFLMFWGLKARTGKLIVNARSETAAEKLMFRDSWASHRCIIPASWYFEWDHIMAADGTKKTGSKYAIQPVGMDKVFLCGIYRMENDCPHFAVLTREPGDSISFIHDRMPLILPENLIGEWIKPGNDPAELVKYALTDMSYERAVNDDRQIAFSF